MWQKLWDHLLYHLICRWPEFVISIQKLCSGDWDRTIRISVWDWNRYNVSQSLTSLPGLSNDHMHSLASRLFLVTSFTCSTCYKQQSQLRPGNEASLLTVSISRSYSEWADLRLMLGVELTCWQSWTMGRCAWSNKHQKCWFAGLLQERSWFNKRGAASLASCWEHPWIYDNLHLRLLGDFFPDSNPPCPLRALGRG